MAPTVLVTGANGHVGYTLCQDLIERGYSVRAAIRDASDKEKAASLELLGCEVVGANILDLTEFTAAMDGVDGVFHTAAVYRNFATDPDSEIIRPAVEGARNAVLAAKSTGVRRLVLTSSSVTIGAAQRGSPPRDERDWNTISPHPYVRGKTIAEREACLPSAPMGQIEGFA